jgi:hypothetical protein
MGICLVMVRAMLMCGFTLVVVVVVCVRICRITMNMGEIGVGQECKRLLSPHPMVHQHMCRGVEKGKNDAEG